MEQSSEVIMDQKQSKKLKKYTFLGAVRGYTRDENRLRFTTDAGELVLEFLSPEIFRLVLGRGAEADLRTTPAVLEHGLSYQDYNLEEQEEAYVILTSQLKVLVNRKRFSLKVYDREGRLIHSDWSKQALGWSGKEVRAWKSLAAGERFYGLGEKTGFLDKKGKQYTMWNTDVFEPHVETTDPLYVSIPFLIGFNQGRAYGLYFDNSYRSYFDLASKGEDYYSFWAEGGKMDYYFIFGPSLKEVVSRYTHLTGRTPLPPKWSLGYHQSRYSYHPQEEVLEIANNFRQRDIPCDAIHLDIHYMDAYRVFTWDEQEFNQPEKMLANLAEAGFKVVTIVDPGVKKDPEYEVYQQGMQRDYFCKYLDGQVFEGRVWPGVSVFPDFTRQEVREWWGDLHQKFLAQGVKGIWNDMNEPAVFNETLTMDEEVVHQNDGDMGTHRRFHNLYGFLEGQASYQGLKKYLQERPFVLSRAGFAGSQRYTAIWTGDNRSFWEHLKLAMPMLLNLGLSGITFAGTDVGGFTGNTSPELLTRWVQLGVFMPFFRNHCSIDGINQEPWAFGEKYEAIIRNYIKLRYQLIEHLYNLFYQANREGLPVIRPLVLEYPEDETTYNLSDEFLLGEDILVAPVYEPDRQERLVYLPAGQWYDYWTGKAYAGSQHIIAQAPLDTLPLYVKAGAILPLVDAQNYIGEKELKELKLNIYLNDQVKANSYLFYEDDGLSFAYETGAYNLTDFSYLMEDGELEFIVKNKKKGYTSTYQELKLKFLHLPSQPKAISLDGKAVNSWDYDRENLLLSLPYADCKVKIKF